MTRKHRILAVDDHPTNLEILNGVLQPEYCVKTAIDADEALEMVTEFYPEVVLLDIMMPGIDGYEVCRRMRADATQRNCKIIMLTAKSSMSDRMQGYEAGADDYITKPFDADELLAKVRVFTRLKSVEEVDHMKSELLTLLNHETRTPLSAIMTPVDVLLDDPEMNRSDQRMWLEMIKRNSANLLQFVNKASLLSALKADHVFLKTVEIPLASIVIQWMERNGADDDSRFHLDLDDVVRVKIDPRETLNAIGSLGDYAATLAKSTDPIVLHTRQNPNGAELVFSFRGNIEPRVVPILFDGLNRTDILQHHHEQMGLDLAIAKHVLEAQGASIKIDVDGEEIQIKVEFPKVDSFPSRESHNAVVA